MGYKKVVESSFMEGHHKPQRLGWGGISDSSSTVRQCRSHGFSLCFSDTSSILSFAPSSSASQLQAGRGTWHSSLTLGRLLLIKIAHWRERKRGKIILTHRHTSFLLSLSTLLLVDHTNTRTFKCGEHGRKFVC